jgi:type IV pilus assembly protein PilY1
LIALPSVAVTIPDVPLQSGTAYPAANVRFILDDSGSMAWDFMPGASSSSEVPSVSPVNVALTTYTRNTLYYNPSITYQAWIKAGRHPLHGRHELFERLRRRQPVERHDQPGFGNAHVLRPKDGATNMGATSSYWRYQITPAGGDMVRSEYGTVVGNTNTVSASRPPRRTSTPARRPRASRSPFRRASKR